MEEIIRPKVINEKLESVHLELRKAFRTLMFQQQPTPLKNCINQYYKIFKNSRNKKDFF